MPFNRDNKPRLIERLRGKSGQDLFNEVKSALNSDSRRMRFDTPSFWSSRENEFPRGFPFDDEPSLFRSRRHRPFNDRVADFGVPTDIAEPPGYEEAAKRRVVEPEPDSEPQPAPLNQPGLRNTVPFAQAPSTERPARAMSAPPGNRPARYTSTCEIPVTGDPQPQEAASAPPPAQPAQPSNVRVIPIRVEGRDEPLINSNIDMSSNFAAEPPNFEPRLPRDFGNFRKHSARFQQPSPPRAPQEGGKFQQTTPQESAKFQQSAPQESPRPAPTPKKSPAPKQPTPPSADETDKPSQPPPVPDPTTLALNRIALVEQEVEKLGKDVGIASITSRSDKAYVYLDEMLTRQLLHLDNIDPAGNDVIRQARKDAIISIQKCIAVLESKVPQEPMQVEAESESKEEVKEDETKVSEPAPSDQNSTADPPT